MTEVSKFDEEMMYPVIEAMVDKDWEEAHKQVDLLKQRHKKLAEMRAVLKEAKKDKGPELPEVFYF